MEGVGVGGVVSKSRRGGGRALSLFTYELPVSTSTP